MPAFLPDVIGHGFVEADDHLELPLGGMHAEAAPATVFPAKISGAAEKVLPVARMALMRTGTKVRMSFRR